MQKLFKYPRFCLFLSCCLGVLSPPTYAQDTVQDHVAVNPAIRPQLLHPDYVSDRDLAESYKWLPGKMPIAWILSRPFEDSYAFDAFVSLYLDDVEKSRLYETVFVPVRINTVPVPHLRNVPLLDETLLAQIEQARPFHTKEELWLSLITFTDVETATKLYPYFRIE